MIYCFGDSWGYGSELDFTKEKPFIDILGLKINSDFKNYSVQGGSIGHITHEIFKQGEEFNENDFVVVVIPPDIRSYCETNGSQIHSLWLADENHLKEIEKQDEFLYKEFKHYMDVVSHKKIWFSYHMSLFIFSLQEYFIRKKCQFVFIHNYGKMSLYPPFENLINKDKFLNFEKSLTEILCETEQIDLISENSDAPMSKIFTGVYFEGKGTHPNQLGHEKICELIMENQNFKKWYL
jgi:hypothetical protein